MKTTLIPLKNITTKFFVRTGLNMEHVQYLKDLYEAGERVTPIEVADTAGKAVFELIDGRHRVEAARAAGFASVEAIIHRGLSDEAKVLNAVLANIGGALPPSLADFEHSLELLINLKMSKRDILESFPLPRKVIADYYKLTINKIYKRTTRKATEAVIRGDMSVKDAAERFKVDVQDLRRLLKGGSERSENIEGFLKGLETSVRSLSHNLSKKTQIIIEHFEAGDLPRSDVARWAERIKQSSRKLAATAEAQRARLEAALAEGEAKSESLLTRLAPTGAKLQPVVEVQKP